MRSSDIFSAVRSFTRVVAAAGSAAGAISDHRQPSARALDALGIDPAAFRKIGH